MKKLQHIRDIPGHCFSRHPRELTKDAVYERYRRANTGISLLPILFACEKNKQTKEEKQKEKRKKTEKSYDSAAGWLGASSRGRRLNKSSASYGSAAQIIFL
jgi:hypothetical protein